MENINLEQQFLQLLKIAEQMQGKIIELEKVNSILINGNNQLIEWLKRVEKDVFLLQENMPYEVLDERLQQNVWYPKITNEEKTLSLILNERKSLSRFGDGEFATIEGKIRHKFQTEIDYKLGQRLREVLQSENEMLLVGIADNYGNLAKYTENTQREIRYYMSPAVREVHKELLRNDKEYHNAYISRPYVIYKDKDTEGPLLRFEKLKQIWKGRKCVFVEGDKTRMGVGNDLFANAESIVRILGPAENAFRCYEEILSECKKMPKDSLFILALGPTASVLAYDLCVEGYQALDLGHLDLEYEWFLRGEGGRTVIPTKYNNECADGENVIDVDDRQYHEEIIAKIIA